MVEFFYCRVAIYEAVFDFVFHIYSGQYLPIKLKEVVYERDKEQRNYS